MIYSKVIKEKGGIMMTVRADGEMTVIKVPQQSTIRFLFVWPVIIGFVIWKCLSKKA